MTLDHAIWLLCVVEFSLCAWYTYAQFTLLTVLLCNMGNLDMELPINIAMRLS